MKLSADTPPDGDFVRYLAELEQASPSYQMLKASSRDANLGAVPKAPPLAARLQRLQQAGARRPQTAGAQNAARPPKNVSPLPAPGVGALVGPLLQRLAQALAAAEKKNRN